MGTRVRICREGQDDLVLEHKPGSPLSRTLWLSGHLPPRPLCGGIGRCGRCRVRFVGKAPQALDEECSILGEEAVGAGWRLACRCQIPDVAELVLEVPDAPSSTRQRPAAPGTERAAFLAVDLGTTSLAWRLLAADGRVLDEGQDLNPQAGAGADVLSRVAVASTVQGRHVLAQAVRTYLRNILARSGAQVELVVLAGNTAMSEIFLEEDVTGLAHAPYSCSIRGHAIYHLEDLPPVYIPPLPAPFVGGDITAGLAWLDSMGTPRPWLLADLGTNGEIALVCEDKLFLTSVPLGPALEGIGLECGALAGADVLTDFSLAGMGLAGKTASNASLLAGSRYQGISATGYLSLLALLRSQNVLDEDGSFGPSDRPLIPLAARLARRIDRSREVPRFVVQETKDHGLWLSLRDIEEILKVKAAFAVAVQSLLERAGLAPADLQQVAIAGALGKHVQARVLESLGFVPPGTGRSIRAVGNSSLEGACLLARDEEARGRLQELCAGAVLLQPAQEQDFHEKYVQAMRFAW